MSIRMKTNLVRGDESIRIEFAPVSFEVLRTPCGCEASLPLNGLEYIQHDAMLLRVRHHAACDPEGLGCIRPRATVT